MDAKEFLRQLARMCRTNECIDCPLMNTELCTHEFDNHTEKDIDNWVRIVDRWATDHPIHTNGDELLKQIPGEALRNVTKLQGYGIVTLEVFKDWWEKEVES